MHNAPSLCLTVNYYTATDVVDNGSTLSELALAVFEENFALLCNTITDINLPLTEQFLKEKIITAEEERQVAAITAPLEKLLHLLEIISSSLKADNARSFYIMVKIMKTHGGKQTQTLANHITNRIKVPTDEVLHVCSDKVLVQNEPKGMKYSICSVNLIQNLTCVLYTCICSECYYLYPYYMIPLKGNVALTRHLISSSSPLIDFS